MIDIFLWILELLDMEEWEKHASVLTSMKININFICDKIPSKGVKNFYQEHKHTIELIDS